ncbi:unnamed protein product [Notodromas monacha]|uniref:Methyltransferase FkbM domain-containing protein n=1 Tax=Notodromas monacha TaxID=399045 RepID=A0A7R9BRY9_9CRUS|nr:unnamed protein product [Notodromas monacha]CAG0920598.1 unnamed protein product [Notodromas monacha]
MNEEDKFFVEVGALDGEKFSNTLWLEREKGWTGLLIEPGKRSYSNLVTKRRKCWTANACVSRSNHQEQHVKFIENVDAPELSSFFPLTEPIFNVTLPGNHENIIEVFCLPLADLILSLNRTRVDFLSLDTEGADADIVQNFPWHRVDVRVIMVEKGQGETPIRIYNRMISAGYNLHKELNVDFVFVKA